MTKEKQKFKRLFLDIETSPNILTSWNVGRKINLDYHSIIKERAIICICWKWEGDKQVHSLTWHNGNDRKMLEQFSKVLQEADEILGHNSDKFDLKWIRTRCILYGIPMFPDLQTMDTLKLSKKGFYFNSNRLDYIAKFLGVGRKIKTAPDLWMRILLKNDKKAMDEMVKYCKQDVVVLENVYKKLSPYVLAKSHKAVAEGGEPHQCPECGSNHCISNGVRVMATGFKKRRMHCEDCGKYFSIANSVYEQLKPILDK